MLQQQRWLSQLAGKTEVTEEEAKKFYEEQDGVHPARNG
jgi:hypothetical protein